MALFSRDTEHPSDYLSLLRFHSYAWFRMSSLRTPFVYMQSYLHFSAIATCFRIHHISRVISFYQKIYNFNESNVEWSSMIPLLGACQKTNKQPYNYSFIRSNVFLLSLVQRKSNSSVPTNQSILLQCP